MPKLPFQFRRVWDFTFKGMDQPLKIKVVLLVLLLCCQLSGFTNNRFPGAQLGDWHILSNSHPRLLVGNQSNGEFLQSIASVDWKEQLVAKKQQRVEKYLNLCKEDTEWLVSRLQMNWNTRHSEVYLIGAKFSHSDGTAPVPTVRYSGSRDWATDYKTPELDEVKPYQDDPRGLYLQRKDNEQWEWATPPSTGHIIESINEEVLQLVADAAFLYWLTADKRYAEFATPVFFQYMEGMFHRDPPTQVDDSDQAGLSGLATFEVIHESIVVSLALAYDFLFDYFIKNQLDLKNSQAVFQKWGDQIIKNGVPNNNWNLFQARFLTYIALVLEDNENYSNGKGRQYYLRHTFDESSERQIALKESVLVYDQQNGMWPESPSYSMHVTTTLLEILTLLDHATNADELKNYSIVEKAAITAFQYLFPSGYTVGFGDSNHRIIPPKNLELLISHYKKYSKREKEEMITGLLQELIESGLYERGGSGLFELFFYVNDLPEEASDQEQKSLVSPTFYAPNVSWFTQRLGHGQDALMVSTVGSFGNHAHSNGIAMELFANNYALGPDMGRGISYWNPDHREYYSQFPAHNTVVVDGISGYRPMRSYHPFTLDNSFPKSEERPQFGKVTFGKFSFFEPKTRSDQQRLTTLVQANSQQGYIVDVFRSKKVQDIIQTHDYLYHNLGQSLEFIDKMNQPMALAQTDELSTVHGEQKAYNYFYDKRKTMLDRDFNALFTLKSTGQPDNLMRLWVKGSLAQQVYSVMGPKSRALSTGTAPEEVLDASIPALILRRKTAAWRDPFVVVFNPYFSNRENVVEEVIFNQDSLGTQEITVSLKDGSRDLMVVGTSERTLLVREQFLQNGLVSITRTATNAAVAFIFVSGMNLFQSNGWEIISEGSPATVTVERLADSLVIQSDQPVLLRIPKTPEFAPGQMSIYRNQEVSAVRNGKLSRFNSHQVEYRIAEVYDKVVIAPAPK